MADWTPSGNFLLGQNIDETSTTQAHALGTIAACKHATLGVGEFIYMTGVASTTVGNIVNYDDTWQTALDTSAVGGPTRPLAVAMSANVGSAYGWYQISGMAVAKKANTVSFADGVGLAAGSGLAVAVATGTIMQGAIVRTVASAKSDVTTVAIAINRPHDPSDVS
ncbi:MAG: hypothetical protein GY952_11650 [Rhodobacteraceae bacterium]|nr:hypothetical protein [Paracoccaceae bacterium]